VTKVGHEIMHVHDMAKQMTDGDVIVYM